MIWKIVTVAWLIIECRLSHTPSEKSGEESRWLLRMNRSLLRGWLDEKNT